MWHNSQSASRSCRDTARASNSWAASTATRTAFVICNTIVHLDLSDLCLQIRPRGNIRISSGVSLSEDSSSYSSHIKLQTSFGNECPRYRRFRLLLQFRRRDALKISLVAVTR